MYIFFLCISTLEICILVTLFKLLICFISNFCSTYFADLQFLISLKDFLFEQCSHFILATAKIRASFKNSKFFCCTYYFRNCLKSRKLSQSVKTRLVHFVITSVLWKNSTLVFALLNIIPDLNIIELWTIFTTKIIVLSF